MYYFNNDLFSSLLNYGTEALYNVVSYISGFDRHASLDGFKILTIC